MKIMKTYINRHYLLILCFSFLILTLSSSCDNNNEWPQVELAIELNTGQSIAWNSPGEFLRINTITPDHAWKLDINFPEEELNKEEEEEELDDDEEPNIWCRAEVYQGKGDKSVWLTLDNNLAQEGRHVIISVTLEATSHTAQLRLVQSGQLKGGSGGGGGGASHPNLKALELPAIVDTAWTLYYTLGEFSLEYSLTMKHSKWVAWPLHQGHFGNSGRTDAWQWDQRIPAENSPKREDFSGYDRGHLVPSADRTLTREMNAETFMYSNMTPQHANLNQRIWADLERRERLWAMNQNDTLYICAGGTILRGQPEHVSHYTSPSNMAVPKYNFKVILRKRGTATYTYDAIGFWFENRSYHPKTIVTTAEVKTVRQIEELTGIDFFYNLPEPVKSEVKQQFNPSAWGIPAN